jgi:aerobic carbon-monoxide dehydrogenase medium subunit
MHNFEYHLAIDVKDAVEQLRSDDEAKIISGGMTLLPTLKNRLSAPSKLIDLAAVRDLRGIVINGSDVTIKAMTCHADVAAHDGLRHSLPALSQLAGGIGDPAVRHRGTIGGSVANADPAADYPAAVVGLDGVVETNKRRIAGDDFFVSLFETALEQDEIITAVHFKVPDVAHYLKFRHPASGYAVVGVMVARYGAKVRVAITGASPHVFRATEMEKALEADFSVKAIADLRIDDTQCLGDIHCSAAYRAHLAHVYVGRAVSHILGA